jgi:hypothetical protein
MTRYPSARVLQRFSAEPKPVHAAFNAARDQSCLFQYLEVFRNRGLGRIELTPEFAGAVCLAVCKRANHRAACPVGQGVERLI